MARERAILYLRESPTIQDTVSDKIDSQLHACTQYADRHNYDVIGHISDTDASGDRDDLPGILELLTLASQRKFDVVIIREYARLARDVYKQLSIEKALKEFGIRIESTKEQFDDSPMGRFVQIINAGANMLEKETIKTRMFDGKLHQVRANRKILMGNIRPFGYDVIRTEKSVTLIVNEKEAKIVQMIFHWYVYEGMSYRKIAAELSKRKIPTVLDTTGGKTTKKRAYGQWAHMTVKGIICNELYASGLWRYGKTRTINERTKNGTRKRKKNNDLDGSLIVRVDTIISEDLFNLAQKQRAHNTVNQTRNVKNEYLMRGRIVCKHCENNMSGIPRSAGKYTYQYYECRGNRRREYAQPCNNNGSYRSEIVDQICWEFLTKLFSNPDYLNDQLLDLYNNQDDSDLTAIQLKLDGCTKLIDQHTQAVKGMVKDMRFLTTPIAKEEMASDIAQIEETIAGLKQKAEKYKLLIDEKAINRLTLPKIQNVVEMARALSAEVAMLTDFDEKVGLMADMGVIATLWKEGKRKFIRVECCLPKEILCTELTQLKLCLYKQQNNRGIVITADFEILSRGYKSLAA